MHDGLKQEKEGNMAAKEGRETRGCPGSCVQQCVHAAAVIVILPTTACVSSVGSTPLLFPSWSFNQAKPAAADWWLAGLVQTFTFWILEDKHEEEPRALISLSLKGSESFRGTFRILGSRGHSSFCCVCNQSTRPESACAPRSSNGDYRSGVTQVR